MRDFLVTTKTRNVLATGKAMRKGIAVNEASHGAKEKASQKLALLIAIVKT
jgi:hypothetical protein